MEERTGTYAQFGIFVGGGLGMERFATSGQVPYRTMPGAGPAIRLFLGTGVDEHRAGQR